MAPPGIEWRPLSLILVLAALALVGERLSVTVRGQHLTAAFVAETLMMTLLSPGTAVIVGCVTEVFVCVALRRQSLKRTPVLVGITATYLGSGAMLARLLAPGALAPGGHTSHNATLALVVFGVFMVANALNFALVAVNHRILSQRPFWAQWRNLFLPMLPGQVATAALTAILAVAYLDLGFAALAGLVLVLLIFQSLAVALLRSEERADQLEARTIRLASLQVGVLTTLVETLALRDRATARHSAAVARYARDLARHRGLDAAQQDLVHTAGLLHDIGKFALPDNVLHAKELSEQERSTIRRHPQEGAMLVGRLDGYGPVSDIILYHHENVDGSGYPAGLIGNEIPLLSRMLSVCNVFDTLTARDSYRAPRTAQDAVAELRRVSGQQLDGDVVEQFVAMLEQDGQATVRAENANFAEELAFESRVRHVADIAA
jgi:putative nucleotidyltransferase with HDIG domain